MPAFTSWSFTRWRLHWRWWRTSNCSPLLIYRHREDERLSWPGWLTYSGRLTHISCHPSATGRAQDGERTLARDWSSTVDHAVMDECIRIDRLSGTHPGWLRWLICQASYYIEMMSCAVFIGISRFDESQQSVSWHAHHSHSTVDSRMLPVTLAVIVVKCGTEA